MSSVWGAFLTDLERDILPLYRAHEATFDAGGIHGRMHVCRSIVFGEYMVRHYRRATALRPDAGAVRYAIAFHDAAREANGADLWEHRSEETCRAYLASRGFPDAAAIASLIPKDGTFGETVEKRIVRDADVLDIMRPCCGHGGRAGFHEPYLAFLGDADDPSARDSIGRSRLIEEAWRFIGYSETLKPRLYASRHYLRDLLESLHAGRARWPALSKALQSAE